MTPSANSILICRLETWNIDIDIAPQLGPERTSALKGPYANGACLPACHNNPKNKEAWKESGMCLLQARGRAEWEHQRDGFTNRTCLQGNISSPLSKCPLRLCIPIPAVGVGSRAPRGIPGRYSRENETVWGLKHPLRPVLVSGYACRSRSDPRLSFGYKEKR